MDEKVLKKIIKHYVKESLTEIFAEMKLETLIENVVAKKVTAKISAPNSAKLSIKEAIAERTEEPTRPQRPQVSGEDRKKVILERLGGNSMWKDIYADTANSSNPILDDDAGSRPAPDEIPASVLEDMGIMKDYSKHIGIDDKKNTEEDEWKKLREMRAKMLDKNVKRM